MNKLYESYESKLKTYKPFLAYVESFFRDHKELNKKPLPIIHSIKSRIKEFSHLEEKLKRKGIDVNSLNNEDPLLNITDLIGIRILHLYQDQFLFIHNAIKEQIDNKEWIFCEKPKAYTWDPEYKKLYEGLDIDIEIKPTYYTSIHYLVAPNNNNPSKACCEIQIRTLFEEIWGEIDHTINYPHPTKSIACKEQLRVLSKLVSTGTRLADSIFRSHEEFCSNSTS